MRKTKIKWLDKAQKHDYPAAESYLRLTMDSQAAKTVVIELENAGITKFAAKDIFRASGLSLLGVSNSHVEKDQDRIMRGGWRGACVDCHRRLRRSALWDHVLRRNWNALCISSISPLGLRDCV